ncbi:MAG: hypothetical protein RBT04_01580 [Sphaerochaetaceae bacterium]|nr:hypothetical protein [Sphaerochaetaceae bacterium]
MDTRFVRLCSILLVAFMVLFTSGCDLVSNSWVFALAEVFSETTNNTLAAQYNEGQAEGKTSSSKSFRSLEGVTITGEPEIVSVTAFKLVDAQNPQNESSWDEQALPDPDAGSEDTGTWKIILDIHTTAIASIDNFAKDGWTCNGTVSENFAAEIEYQLDIPGENNQPYTSMVKRSTTTLTINGDVDVSGKDNGRLVIESMQFIVEAFDNQNPYCEYVEDSGTARFSDKDVTEDIIDIFEEEIAFFSPT